MAAEFWTHIVLAFSVVLQGAAFFLIFGSGLSAMRQFEAHRREIIKLRNGLENAVDEIELLKIELEELRGSWAPDTAAAQKAKGL